MTQLPVQEGQWQLDLLSPETLKTLGLDTASAAAKGAAVGVGVDLVFAGLSLGVATATGAALGAAWHTSRRFGQTLMNKMTGKQQVEIDDATLDILLLRQLWLLHTVLHRGHAAANPSQLDQRPTLKLPDNWQSVRQSLRNSAAGWGKQAEQVTDECAAWVQGSLKEPSS